MQTVCEHCGCCNNPPLSIPKPKRKIENRSNLGLSGSHAFRSSACEHPRSQHLQMFSVRKSRSRRSINYAQGVLRTVSRTSIRLVRLPPYAAPALNVCPEVATEGPQCHGCVLARSWRLEVEALADKLSGRECRCRRGSNRRYNP